ncbi:hypothetical protein HMPREF9444_00765 [Succinatimonas hippei YIT 12066]|uniref:Uncharacterized protein n=1 Tax=Succinatimonas hippei (strain DSM 22608 / JCM 16073 / KCTC 15190 / YIT 12066) TaxID=762983 RepID=E8LJC6_SUCHY|nr:hypothetical protein HMPREF9444_00765 [Succinatimonas hippei YIT 12066]
MFSNQLPLFSWTKNNQTITTMMMQLLSSIKIKTASAIIR